MALIGARSSSFATAECLLATCHALHALTRDDGFYRFVAHLQWGHEFWDRALQRPCHRTFASFRQELRIIDQFQASLRSHGMDPWGAEDFERFWAYEAAVYGRGARPGRVPVHRQIFMHAP